MALVLKLLLLAHQWQRLNQNSTSKYSKSAYRESTNGQRRKSPERNALTICVLPKALYRVAACVASMGPRSASKIKASTKESQRVELSMK